MRLSGDRKWTDGWIMWFSAFLGEKVNFTVFLASLSSVRCVHVGFLGGVCLLTRRVKTGTSALRTYMYPASHSCTHTRTHTHIVLAPSHMHALMGRASLARTRLADETVRMRMYPGSHLWLWGQQQAAQSDSLHCPDVWGAGQLECRPDVAELLEPIPMSSQSRCHSTRCFNCSHVEK